MSDRRAAQPIDQYTPRERLLTMIFRAELDPDGFGADLKADPVAALERAGFSGSDAQAMLTQSAELAAEPLAALRGSCSDTTCGISICPGTCFITVDIGNPSGCPLFSILPV